MPGQLIDVAPPPIDLDSFRAGERDLLRRRAGLRDDALALLFVGHDFERKGLRTAIHSVAALCERVHLVVIGDGDRRAFAALAARVGVDSRVHFLGGTSEPQRYFAGADALVLPTRLEPWGITIIEAMAAGIPVVTTAVAGASSIVAAAGAGIVVADDSPRSFVSALSALLGDPGRRREMGSRGMAEAHRFGAAAYADIVIRSYEEALRSRIPGRRTLSLVSAARRYRRRSNNDAVSARIRS